MRQCLVAYHVRLDLTLSSSSSYSNIDIEKNELVLFIDGFLSLSIGFIFPPLFLLQEVSARRSLPVPYQSPSPMSTKVMSRSTTPSDDDDDSMRAPSTTSPYAFLDSTLSVLCSLLQAALVCPARLLKSLSRHRWRTCREVRSRYICRPVSRASAFIEAAK